MTKALKLQKGLETFNKYSETEISVGHEIVYANNKMLNMGDAKKLIELGWFFDEEVSSWCLYI